MKTRIPSNTLFTFSFSLLFVSNFSLFTASAQTKLDSLFSVWNNPSMPDSIRVDAYQDYIWEGYLFSNLDSAQMLTEILLQFADEQDFPKAACTAYNLMGIVQAIRGNHPEALKFYEKALKIEEEIGFKRGIAGSLGNIGGTYADQGNFPKALEYFEKSLKMYEEIESKMGTATILVNIGGIYLAQRNYISALEYGEKTLQIFEELGDKQGIAGSLNDIGNIYFKQENYATALEYYERARIINEEIFDKQGIARTMKDIGSIYAIRNEYPKALEFNYISIKLFKEIGDKQGISNSLSTQGILYGKMKHYKVALTYCQEGLNIAEEFKLLIEQKSACQCLYDTYKALGNGDEALVYLEKMRIVEDSLQSEETAKKLKQMEFAAVMLQDSIAKAEEARLVRETHQAEVRKKNQTRNVFIVFSLILLLLAIGLYSRWRYVHKSKAVLQTEKDRSENLLLNILPAEIAEELKQNGRAEARDFDMVSILFTDFKGFTEHSAKLSAAELVHEINHCFEAFDGIMAKYHIEKIKTIGDAYMAAGGLPVPTDDSVKNTVLAALEMQAFISKRKSENEAAGKPAFEMRVGIHTGPVVAGIVGVKKFQYDIWGDTVNTASRMESNGTIGRVNVSSETFALLMADSDFQFEEREEIEVKGKGRMKMYFVSTKN